MVNTSVKGRLVDRNNTPLIGLRVDAYDNDVLIFRDFLGTTTTNSDGSFQISYTPPTYGPIEKQPDIVLEVYQGTTLIFKTRESHDVKEDVLDVGTLVPTGQNIGLKGKVVDENNRPIPGLVVVAHDIDIGSRNDLLGRTVTDVNGDYQISYSPSAYYAINDQNPDIVVTIFDRVGIRELAKTGEFSDEHDAILNIPKITIPLSLVESWAASLGSSVPSQLTKGNYVELLVDGAGTFEQIAQSIKNARTTIHLLQLFWTPEFIATFTGDPTGLILAPHPKDILVNLLLDANRRGVIVKILLNENAIIPDTYDEIKHFFKNAGNNTITVRRFPLTVQTLHAKTLIVDSKDAFIIGSPFEQGYWDTRDHSLVESRRGELTGIGARPLHDVSIHVKGPAVADIENNFATLWNFRSDQEFGGADKISPATVPASAGNQSLQIVRSLPKKILPQFPNGESGILEAYQRAIGNASRFIYIENQYFSGRAITNTLVRALRNNPTLQVILLINERPDIPGYTRWQNYRLLKQIGFPHRQVGVFSLWNTGLAAGRITIQNCYLHSKVAIVDDKWGTVGTANLDGISLEEGSELTYVGIQLGSNKRHVEINAVLLEGVDGQPTTGNIASIRHSLWSEHLGITIPTTVPSGGWLPFWNKIARDNVASLNTSHPSIQGKILPYSMEHAYTDQLRSIGVDLSYLNVLD